MPLITDSKRQGYSLTRAASQGAGITLVSHALEYHALFDCAAKCSKVLGKPCVPDLEFPLYKISLPEMLATCSKLSAKHSIALLDYHNGRFVLVWHIPCTGQEIADTTAIQPPDFSLDDF